LRKGKNIFCQNVNFKFLTAVALYCTTVSRGSYSNLKNGPGTGFNILSQYPTSEVEEKKIRKSVGEGRIRTRRGSVRGRGVLNRTEGGQGLGKRGEKNRKSWEKKKEKVRLKPKHSKGNKKNIIGKN
jgi:hypothetical protein